MEQQQEAAGALYGKEDTSKYQYKRHAAASAHKQGKGYFYWHVPCRKCGGNVFYVSSMSCTECLKRRRKEYYQENKENFLSISNQYRRERRRKEFINSIRSIAIETKMLVLTGDKSKDDENFERIRVFAFELLRQKRNKRILSSYINFEVDTEGLRNG